MKTLKNEKGYALLMVLMLIILFTVLGMGLMATNMNSAAQFNTKEEKVKARHQAEMGVLHYKAQLIELVESSSSEEIICNNFINEVSRNSQDSKSSYEINSGNIDCELNDSVITLSVESKGNYINQEEKIKAKFYINKMGGNIVEEGEVPQPDDYSDDVKIVEGSLKVENGFYSPDESSLYVKGNFTVQHGNSNGGNDILIERNLFIDQNMTLHNHACLVTRGNLIVKGSISSTNKVYIFVYGDAYFSNHTYRSSNNNFFVSGKVFENGMEVQNRFDSVPEGNIYNTQNGNGKGNDKKSCPLPGSGNPGPSTEVWELDDQVDVDYFVD